MLDNFIILFWRFKMNILLMTRFYLNGQTTHVFSLCQELHRQNHNPYLIASYLHDPSYIQALRTHNIPFSTTTRPLNTLEVLRKMKFSVIHAHSAHSLTAAIQLGRNLGIPVVATCHYLDYQALELLDKVQKVI